MEGIHLARIGAGVFLVSVMVGCNPEVLPGEDDLNPLVEGLELSFIGNTPVREVPDSTTKEMEVNGEELRSIFKDLKMTHFHYSLFQKNRDREVMLKGLEKLVSEVSEDESLRLIIDQNLGRPVTRAQIQELEEPQNGMKFQDRYGRLAKTTSAYAAIARTEAIADIKKFAEWSKQAPKLISGIMEDDFLAKRKGATLLKRDFFKQLCQEARAIQPTFQISVVIYCFSQPSVDPESEAAVYASFLNHEYDGTSPTRQISTLVDYLSDPEVDACINEVAIYNQGEGATPGMMQPWTENDFATSKHCMDVAKEKLPGKKLTQGVYLTAYDTLPLEGRIQNLEYALKTGAQSLLFFYTPTKPYQTAAQNEEEVNDKVRAYLKKRLGMGEELASSE